LQPIAGDVALAVFHEGAGRMLPFFASICWRSNFTRWLKELSEKTIEKGQGHRSHMVPTILRES